MGFNQITNIESCYIELPHLLYYSHIPAIIVSLLLGLFVYLSNRKFFASKILLLIAVTFSLWSSFDLILWIGHDSRILMFFWALWAILYGLLLVFSLYFVYAFVDKKDVSFKKKLVIGLLFLPIIILTPTIYNLTGFDQASCNPMESNFLLNYVIIFLGIFVSLWIIALSISRYRTVKEPDLKKQIIYVSLGTLLFLLSFYSTAYVASLMFITTLVDSFKFEQYGYFGIIIFMAFLAYLIVRFKAFNIKLLATQAFVAALVILIGSQFFFVENTVNIVLIGITLALTTVFGYMLIKSVNEEVKRKEELQRLSDQLAIANDQLRKLDRAKTEFISIASHQLRTPLTSIKGFISLLLEGTYGEVDPNQRTVMEKVYISNERLIQLVEDLLNVSRIESGRMEFDFQMAQVENLTKEVTDALEIMAKDKSLYLDYRKPNVALPKVKIDSKKIKEVISNLVENAIKYTQRGGVTVRFEAGKPYGGGDTEVVRIIVSDTGIGIDPQEIKELFQKFQRGKEVNHYHTEGTGLGLFVAKKVMDAHQGRIWAESEGAGRGSRFIMELPTE